MNIIKEQAKHFFKKARNQHEFQYSVFISTMVKAISIYKKPAYKIEFLEVIYALVKDEFDHHLVFCVAHHENTCRFSEYYKNVLFYISEELQVQESKLSEKSFDAEGKRIMNEHVQDLLDFFNAGGSEKEMRFVEFRLELEDLKRYYYLDKKTWMQLFVGKIAYLAKANVFDKNRSEKMYKKVSEIYAKIISHPVFTDNK